MTGKTEEEVCPHCGGEYESNGGYCTETDSEEYRRCVECGHEPDWG